MALEENPLNEDWRITQAQYDLATDKLKKLSKKEAGLVIEFIIHCVLNRRTNTYLQK